MTTLDELATTTATAAAAAPAVAASSPATRAAWLRAAADALDANVDELVGIADRETRLGRPRLTGEVGRTSGQLRLFADVVLDGAFHEAIIDHAVPDATPPRPDLRRILRPIGPVAVFSASNFPFAFSVAGGDTASALAAGNPVVVKAHSGHLDLSTRVAGIVAAALEAAGAPHGTLQLVTGRETGSALVVDPAIAAVGFTGSVDGGRALFALAAGRDDPIPFYGELGSINPVVVTPSAADGRGDELAAGFTASFTLGAGQFCTKPGLVFVPFDSAFERAAVAAVRAVETTSSPLLTDRISEGFGVLVGAAAADPDVEVLAGDAGQSSSDGASPVLLATTAAAVVERAETLAEERFGPTSLLVRYRDEAELLAAIRALPGSLTGTIHADPDEAIDAVVDALVDRSGRLLFGGWPTGVAVTWSQHHGGPWPATTSFHSSVGATAIRRFLRPITFQDAPDAILPEALREANPLGIPRRVDGVQTV
ncbi:aldehyde dehydrogenase (NADP(+)) [Plantibacter sp. ME-Dv--P-122b]|uniref:aldehyde dehydrogenase (NADP(+)) n=1 Tax=Plantibacter sp. ME-Dv--P-122b TaxID=3040300 RepID=UPI002549D09D|nr:aldehyde dehydrogenase (NADP(+)) [Plantibacter sp. ME-Dv--P-122b]